MSEPRLSASVEVSALLRKVSADGDFGTILRRGDSDRGSILIVIESRGRHICCLQRQLNFSTGSYSWAEVEFSSGSGSDPIASFLRHQARFDPDLWQIELDIAEPERFIAETKASG